MKDERAREVEYERKLDEKWASFSDEGDVGCLSDCWAALLDSNASKLPQ